MDEIRTSIDLVSQYLIVFASLGYVVFSLLLVFRKGKLSIENSVVRYYVIYCAAVFLLSVLATTYYLVDPPSKGSFLDTETGRSLANQPSFE